MYFPHFICGWGACKLLDNTATDYICSTSSDICITGVHSIRLLALFAPSSDWLRETFPKAKTVVHRGQVVYPGRVHIFVASPFWRLRRLASCMHGSLAGRLASLTCAQEFQQHSALTVHVGESEADLTLSKDHRT